MRNRQPGRRAAARLATIAIAAALPVLTAAAPALALHRDDGARPGPSLGAGLTILYYVVIPVGAFLVIAALSVLPSTLSRPRYRPGKPWDREAKWIGAPADETAGAAAAKDSARGGASAEW
ncbi:MAG TPA: hypothetical protein VG650_18400 [Mycobacteriales bacterium]|nr:hypothetical protein [Mycobacteriales bacterium]